MVPSIRGDEVVVPTCPGQVSYHVEIIHPTLQGQQCLSFVAVVIKRLKKGFVGIRIGLSAHDDAVQVQIYLLKVRVPQVVGDIEELGVGTI